jgi:hypothetical protein
MNETEIKTRLGLILESVVAAALKSSGYTFEQDFQYDEACEVPDFLIPDGNKPSIMIELHQTEARNSFQMKTLRAFTAVTESKAHFGNDLISVNVLFGDPETELPPSNVKAMGGICDVNIIPRRDCADRAALEKMEQKALEFAQTDGLPTEKAGAELVKESEPALTSLAKLFKAMFEKAKAKEALVPIWDSERKRLKTLNAAPKSGDATYYKKMMLRALFLSDEDFAELVAKTDPGDCSASVQEQILAVGIATREEEIDGDRYELDPEFLRFLKDPQSPRLRRLCKEVLDTVPAMHWFFEDIRDAKRRLAEATEIIRLVNAGRTELVEGIVENLRSDTAFGLDHRRCWIADGLSIIAKQSQNSFNKTMVQSGRDPENYQYPYNNITGKFERLMGCPHHFSDYSGYAVDVFLEFTRASQISITPVEMSPLELANGILELRLDGAVKLQRLNPLNIILQACCADLGIVASQVKSESLVFDIAGGKGRLGKYDVFELSYGHSKIMAISVAVHDNNGDHKSKEWGARRLSTLYRLNEHGVRPSEYQNALFVLDGEWTDKDVARLHRCGWNRVVRLGQLEDTLREVFDIKATDKSKISPLRIALEDMEDEPITKVAEAMDAAPKKKRNGGYG